MISYFIIWLASHSQYDLRLTRTVRRAQCLWIKTNVTPKLLPRWDVLKKRFGCLWGWIFSEHFHPSQSPCLHWRCLCDSIWHIFLCSFFRKTCHALAVHGRLNILLMALLISRVHPMNLIEIPLDWKEVQWDKPQKLQMLLSYPQGKQLWMYYI